MDEDSFQADFQGEEDYASWQEMVRAKSLYDTKIMPKAGQKTVTLMTCTPAGKNYRFLIHGVLAD